MAPGGKKAGTAGSGIDADKTHTILEAIEFSDESEDDFQYEELPEDPELMEDEDETLDDFNRLLAETKPREDLRPGDQDMAQIQQSAQVIDDFFRNYLTKNEMRRSLESFQSEWYELQSGGKFKDTELQIVQQKVGDFLRNFLTKYGMRRSLETFQTESYELEQTGMLQDSGEVLLLRQDLGLSEEVTLLRQEIDKARQVAMTAKASWDKFRKERDFHRMHHRRVVQEKNRLIIDLKRLKKHYEQYEPTLTELRHKYEVAMKEKMLMRLERDRFLAKAESLQKQLNQVQLESKDEGVSKDLTNPESSRRAKAAEAPWPSEDRVNPYASHNFDPPKDLREFKRTQQFKGHSGAISRMAFHPKIPVVATASDDHTWKMWSMPEGQLVLSGEGHRDWVSGIDFHPRGSLVATTSGDFTTKIWDITKQKCKHTLTDHNQAVWACAFHDQGDFLVTCSMDQTAKAYDMQSMRCRQTFRGHVDSVNYVTFQPFSNNVLTASGDKTISLWDLRAGLCVQTFYGHHNACNHATFALKGDHIVSCDSDGLVKLWDVRVVSEFLQIDTGQHPANSATFDKSGKVLVIASGDASIKTFNVDEKAWLVNHLGHEDAVQDVVFEPQTNKYMLSCSSDSTFALWQ
jgi:WD40 repeat protein